MIWQRLADSRAFFSAASTLAFAAASAVACLAVSDRAAAIFASRWVASLLAAACFLVEVVVSASCTREESRVASWRAWMRAVVMPDSC